LASLLQREFSPESLAEALGPQTATLEKYWQSALGDPLVSIAQRTGKGLRSRLLVIAWAIAGGRAELPSELIGIVEGLHLGSLIIDDIEDGSITRRGGPTLHQQIGVSNALNAGNWLYFWPALLVPRLQLAPDRELQLRRALDRAVLNAHYGQALDLALHVTDLRQPDVAQVVHACTELKTGCLMELGARIGAIAAGASRDCVDLLGRIGRDFGIALQMLDDLTSVLSERRRHKGREDVVLARPTWAWAWFAQSADELSYGRLRLQLQRVLDGLSDPEEVVATLASRVAGIGRACITEQLATTVTRAESHFGASNACNDLEQWARELANYEG
jgi:geranylgeranyl pyrophosphate synthase